MSLVTSVVLVVSGDVPDEIHDALTAPLEDANGQKLGRWEHSGYARGEGEYRNAVDDWAGGHKSIGLEVYAAGLNYVTPGKLIEHLRSLPWGRTQAVLVYEYEGDLEGDWNLKPVIISPSVEPA